MQLTLAETCKFNLMCTEHYWPCRKWSILCRPRSLLWTTTHWQWCQSYSSWSRHP